MKTSFLFPNRYKKIGWFLLAPASVLGFFVLFLDFEFKFLDLKVFAIYAEGFKFFGDPVGFFRLVEDNLTNELLGIMFLIGAIFTAFSKEKQEDEFISNTRMESLLWATYINYAVLIFCMMFFFNYIFLYVLILNMFTILIFFIIRFNYILYKTKKSLGYEK
jgi:hypothetical protein